MESNFLNTVKNYLSGEFLHQAANSLNEESPRVSSAIDMVIPTGMAAILHKVVSTKDGETQVYKLIKDFAPHFYNMPNVGHLQGFDEGDVASKDFLGNKEADINTVISKYSGVTKNSVSSLFSLVLPVILGLLGKHASQYNLSAGGLGSFIKGQRENILSAVPPEINALPGFFNFSGPSPHVTAATHEIIERKKQRTWVLPIILILAAFALLIWLSRRPKPVENNLTRVDTSKVITTDTFSNGVINPSPAKENIKVQPQSGK